MFALADMQLFESVNLKCDPEIGAQLREEYAGVKPGYHMNKKHWITVTMDGSIPDKLVKAWIDNSYALVVASLPKRQQEAMKAL